jgi:hypothetical protein
LLTASFGWIVLGLAFPLTIGPFHYGAIGCNGIVMLFTAAAANEKDEYSFSSFAAALTFVVWDYLGVISLISCLTVMRNLYF